jgi:hypothetical protein
MVCAASKEMRLVNPAIAASASMALPPGEPPPPPGHRHRRQASQTACEQQQRRRLWNGDRADDESCGWRQIITEPTRPAGRRHEENQHLIRLQRTQQQDDETAVILDNACA